MKYWKGGALWGKGGLGGEKLVIGGKRKSPRVGGRGREGGWGGRKFAVMQLTESSGFDLYDNLADVDGSRGWGEAGGVEVVGGEDGALTSSERDKGRAHGRCKKDVGSGVVVGWAVDVGKAGIAYLLDAAENVLKIDVTSMGFEATFGNRLCLILLEDGEHVVAVDMYGLLLTWRETVENGSEVGRTEKVDSLAEFGRIGLA